MPTKVTVMEQTEQPLSWKRALGAGFSGATLMVAFVDIFYMMGVTPFSYAAYLGSLIFDSSSGTHIWTVGLIANWILGAVFGVVYAFFFEDVLRSSGSRQGAMLGFGHAFLAGIAIFPFFGAIRGFMGIALYDDFGFFGVGLGPATPILILFSHLIYGTTVGTFYGPVGRKRVRGRFFEPWPNIPPGQSGAITEEEDAPDRIAM